MCVVSFPVFQAGIGMREGRHSLVRYSLYAADGMITFRADVTITIRPSSKTELDSSRQPFIKLSVFLHPQTVWRLGHPHRAGNDIAGLIVIAIAPTTNMPSEMVLSAAGTFILIVVSPASGATEMIGNYERWWKEQGED
jgi:hypothetical protein